MARHMEKMVLGRVDMKWWNKKSPDYATKAWVEEHMNTTVRGLAWSNLEETLSLFEHRVRAHALETYKLQLADKLLEALQIEIKIK